MNTFQDIISEHSNLITLREYLKKPREGSNMSIFGDEKYCEHILEQIITGLPAIALRVSDREIKRYPHGVSARILSFLYSYIFGFLIIDTNFLNHLKSNGDSKILLEDFYREARPRAKVVIAMTDNLPLPRILKEYSNLFITSKDNDSKLLNAYPIIKDNLILAEDNYWSSLPDWLLRSLRREFSKEII